MPVYEAILGSGWIALGIWTAARSVISLTMSRTKQEMTKPGARERQLRLLGGSLSSCILGIVFATNSLHNDAARWLLATAATALLIWYISSDVGSWRRSRRQRKSAQQQAENNWASQAPWPGAALRPCDSLTTFSWPLGSPAWWVPHAGSKTGAAIRPHLRSDALTAARSIRLTCGNVPERESCQHAAG
jgi:hypothetical protein